MGDYWGGDYFNDGYWEADYWGATVASPTDELYLLADFATGNTVTVNIYRLSDDALVVSAASMSEIASTGTFKYAFSQTISTKMEYLYIASNGSTVQQGKIILNVAVPLAEAVWENEDDPVTVDSKAGQLARADINTQGV
ncbi:MAG: hypothetical protein DRN81_03155 [Thermoproteota archaeon]|nr:MAG: hypothetical protein DRN81_03155 [Candidatus Korarchaeota archaeon]